MARWSRTAWALLRCGPFSGPPALLSGCDVAWSRAAGSARGWAPSPLWRQAFSTAPRPPFAAAQTVLEVRTAKRLEPAPGPAGLCVGQARSQRVLRPPMSLCACVPQAAQARLFHPRLEELRQQHAVLPFEELVAECRKRCGHALRRALFPRRSRLASAALADNPNAGAANSLAAPSTAAAPLLHATLRSMAPGMEGEAARVCEALHSAGVILRQGSVAFLRPADIEDVALQVLHGGETAECCL